MGGRSLGFNGDAISHRLWLECGVHTGGTITIAAGWRSSHCGAGAPPLHGFDTFTGLPEDWVGEYTKVRQLRLHLRNSDWVLRPSVRV